MSDTTIVLLEADQFDATLGQVATTAEQSAAQAGFSNAKTPVRRPYRGIEIGEDTYATLQVWNASTSSPIQIRDSGGAYRDANDPSKGVSYAYSNFVMQSISETRAEKTQIVETFGQDYMFFFGERPRFVQVGAKLVNTPDFNWRSEWWHNYENTFRGSQLVNQGARVYLTYESVILEGYLVASQTNQNAQNPRVVTMTFSMWVTGYRDISEIGSVNFPGSWKGQVTPADASAAQTYGGSSAVPRSLAVRQANIAAAAGGVASLTDLVSNVLDVVSTGIHAVNYGLDYFKNIVLGKQVRVPPGYLGSELLTQVNEVASGSLPAGVSSVSGLSSKLKIALGTTTVPGQLPVRTKPLRGEIYTDNWDEYAQGASSGAPTEKDWREAWLEAESVLAASSASEAQELADLEFRAREAFSAQGVNPDVFVSEDALFLAKHAFGAAAFLVATGMEMKRKNEEDYLRAEAQNATDYHLQTSGDYDPGLDQINYTEYTWVRDSGSAQTGVLEA